MDLESLQQRQLMIRQKSVKSENRAAAESISGQEWSFPERVQSPVPTTFDDNDSRFQNFSEHWLREICRVEGLQINHDCLRIWMNLKGLFQTLNLGACYILYLALGNDCFCLRPEPFHVFIPFIDDQSRHHNFWALHF